MTWFFIGLISFLRHPIKFTQYIFGSWHANQHANEAQPYIIKVDTPLTHEQGEQIRKHMEHYYRQQGKRPFG